jgi:hypothetical protein
MLDSCLLPMSMFDLAGASSVVFTNQRVPTFADPQYVGCLPPRGPRGGSAWSAADESIHRCGTASYRLGNDKVEKLMT